MTMSQENQLSHEEMVEYIKHHVDDLSVPERYDILQMIINSSVEDNKIHTKGDGTQVKFKYISKPVVANIYNYMLKKITGKMDQFKCFSDVEEEPNTEE